MKQLEELSKSKYDIKTVRIGPRKNDDKEARLLNGPVRATTYGLKLQADKRFSGMIIDAAGLKRAKGVSTPFEKNARNAVSMKMQSCLRQSRSTALSGTRQIRLDA